MPDEEWDAYECAPDDDPDDWVSEAEEEPEIDDID